MSSRTSGTSEAGPIRASRQTLPGHARRRTPGGRDPRRRFLTDAPAAGRPYRWGAARNSGWTTPLLLWLGSRVLSTVVLAAVFGIATASGWPFASHRADPSFWTFSGSWDASAYRTIATEGYPSALPRDDTGAVLPNPWAFLPVFPAVVRVLMATGLSFWVAGVVVATLCGAGACIVLYRLVLAVAGPHRAGWATALFAFGPLGFLLQVSYAEGMFLLLLFGGMLALVRQRYWLVAPLGVVAAFTRPGVLAFAVAVAAHLVARWIATRRTGATFPWRDRVVVTASGLLVAVAGMAWPVVAAVVTGTPGAYVDTELSWWTGYVGRQHFVPGTPWFLMADTWLGPAGVVLVVLVLVGALWVGLRRDVRALGPEVLAYSASYAAYLVAVFLPQQSLFRLLMPMAPLLGADRFVGTRRRAVVLLVVGIVLQPVAVMLLWFLGYP